MDPRDPLVLRLAAIEDGESHLELVADAPSIGLEGDHFEVLGPIVARIRVYRMGPRLDVRGPIQVRIRQVCGRCLGPVERQIEADLRVFAERPDSRDPRETEEVREDDVGIVYHDGHYVDLTEEVRQVLLVEIPWHPFCRSDCRGLCPVCGADLNGEGCTCPKERIDPRWQALLDLREREEDK